jgi:polyisoprenoid-binding protein YceI
MSRFWKIALPVVALLVAAGVAGWWFFLRDDAPPEARLVTRDAPATVPASPAGTWAIQPGEKVFAGYRVTEQFAGETIEKTAVGRSRAVTGTMVVEASGGDVRIPSAEIEVDMTALTSNSDRRDNRLRGDGLETDQFPSAAFVLTQPVVLATPPVAGQPFEVQVTGTLTLHGVTKEVTIPLTVSWSGEFIDIAGQLPIVLADYGINPPNVGGFVSVDEDGVLELQLTFAPA